MIGNMLLMALREVRRHAMRSALTMLGIIIGVAAVIPMVTLGGGATETLKDLGFVCVRITRPPELLPTLPEGAPQHETETELDAVRMDFEIANDIPVAICGDSEDVAHVSMTSGSPANPFGWPRCSAPRRRTRPLCWSSNSAKKRPAASGKRKTPCVVPPKRKRRWPPRRTRSPRPAARARPGAAPRRLSRRPTRPPRRAAERRTRRRQMLMFGALAGTWLRPLPRAVSAGSRGLRRRPPGGRRARSRSRAQRPYRIDSADDLAASDGERDIMDRGDEEIAFAERLGDCVCDERGRRVGHDRNADTGSRRLMRRRGITAPTAPTAPSSPPARHRASPSPSASPSGCRWAFPFSLKPAASRAAHQNRPRRRAGAPRRPRPGRAGTARPAARWYPSRPAGGAGRRPCRRC